MDSGVVVLPDCLIDSENELAERFEALRITEVDLELGIEGLLVAVLPRTTRFAARDSDTCALKESTE